MELSIGNYMYKNMNDYEIIYMIKEEDSDIFNILYYKYQPLIYKIAKSNLGLFKTFGYELEDVMQLGYLTLYKCSFLYNVYNDSFFYSYFKNAFKNTLFSEIRKNKTAKKEVLNCAFSYDNIIPNTKLRYVDVLPCKEKDNVWLYNKTFMQLKNSMSYSLSCIFELYFNGYSLKEISILLDEEEEVIKRRYQKIKHIILTYKYLFFKKDMLQ